MFQHKIVPSSGGCALHLCLGNGGPTAHTYSKQCASGRSFAQRASWYYNSNGRVVWDSDSMAGQTTWLGEDSESSVQQTTGSTPFLLMGFKAS